MANTFSGTRDQYTALLQQHPDVIAAMQAIDDPNLVWNPSALTAATQKLKGLMAQYNIPDAPGGSLINPQNGQTRKDWLGTLSTVGMIGTGALLGAGALGAFGPVLGSAGTSAASAGGAGAVGTGGAASAASGAAGGAGAAGAGAAGAAAGGINPWLMGAIGAGTSIAKGLIDKSAANKATAAETAAANQALALQQQQYEQTRGDLAPYRTAGSSSLANLGAIFGVNTGGSGAPVAAPVAPGQSGQFQRQISGPSFPGTYAGQAVPRPAASPMSDALIPVQAPDGNVYHVPASRVPAAQAQGGRVVGGTLQNPTAGAAVAR